MKNNAFLQKRKAGKKLYKNNVFVDTGAKDLIWGKNKPGSWPGSQSRMTSLGKYANRSLMNDKPAGMESGITTNKTMDEPHKVNSSMSVPNLKELPKTEPKSALMSSSRKREQLKLRIAEIR